MRKGFDIMEITIVLMVIMICFSVIVVFVSDYSVIDETILTSQKSSELELAQGDNTYISKGLIKGKDFYAFQYIENGKITEQKWASMKDVSISINQSVKPSVIVDKQSVNEKRQSIIPIFKTEKTVDKTRYIISIPENNIKDLGVVVPKRSTPVMPHVPIIVGS